MNSKSKKARGAAQKGAAGAAAKAKKQAAMPVSEEAYTAGVPRSEDEDFVSREGESVASVIDVPIPPKAQPVAAEAPKPARKAANPVVRALKRDLTRQGASMLDDAECAGGSMAHAHTEGSSHLADGECAGGSMEHTHTEGVSRAAHAARMAAIDAHDATDGDVLPHTIDARTLRRAVVMSEVLGRPKGLRLGVRQ